MNATNTNTTFQFLGTDVRIVMDERGEPLFVGRDVCEVLEYVNPDDAMNDHCKGIAKRYPLQTAGGPKKSAQPPTPPKPKAASPACT